MAEIDRLDRFRHRGVQRKPLTGQELVVDGLPDQAVTEPHDAIIAGHQEVPVDGLPERGGNLRLPRISDPREDVMTRDLAGDRDDA
jgi:hypothetical protein